MNPLRVCLLISLSLLAAPLLARETLAVPAHGVIGVSEAQLSADFWIARLRRADRVLLDPAAIEAQNARLIHADPSMYDLRALPATLTRAQIVGWIENLASAPTQPLYDEAGQPLAADNLAAMLANRDLDAIPATQASRYGLLVQRADLRAFPSRVRVFSEPGDTDIDRFQESGVFPGTPVLIAHASRDGQWWFVVSPRYAAWIEKKFVAEGGADEVFGYAEKTPYRIVTGASVQTVFTPAPAALSRVQLDMGVRVPVLADWSADKPVNGQHPYTAHVIELPLRKDDGSLQLVPALLQKNTDTRGNYLPLSEANIIRQAFQFLGERYGWGHAYDARDCSGFVSDVYQSMGVTLPRNTRDQSVSPALRKRLFSEADDRATRLQAARAMSPGDLIYIPGHVMMVIGNVDGAPYVIHDTTGLSYRLADGSLRRVTLNQVSVSPLLPLQFNDTQTYVDRMTSIVTMRPAPTKDVRPVP